MSDERETLAQAFSLKNSWHLAQHSAAMAAQDEFAGEYQALADPENGPGGEAKHFKKILKHSATAAGDSQATGNKED